MSVGSALESRISNGDIDCRSCSDHRPLVAASLFAIFFPFFRSLVGSIIPPREVAEVLAPETSTSEVVSSMGTGVRLKIWLSLDLIRGLTDQLDGSPVRP